MCCSSGYVCSCRVALDLSGVRSRFFQPSRADSSPRQTLISLERRWRAGTAPYASMASESQSAGLGSAASGPPDQPSAPVKADPTGSGECTRFVEHKFKKNICNQCFLHRNVHSEEALAISEQPLGSPKQAFAGPGGHDHSAFPPIPADSIRALPEICSLRCCRFSHTHITLLFFPAVSPPPRRVRGDAQAALRD